MNMKTASSTIQNLLSCSYSKTSSSFQTHGLWLYPFEEAKDKKRVTLTPRKVYPYMSVKNSLETLNRPGLLDKCEQWRSRKNTMLGSDYLGDVYDGEVWQKFCSQEFNNFLCTPHSYLLNINVDWFQPFVRGTTYSTGAIYLTVQNLPRHERYLQSNLILVGLLPGPSEPKSTMNSYLTPLVEELHELWNGVVISESKQHYLVVHVIYPPAENYVAFWVITLLMGVISA